ncbi:MAG: flagellar hook-length control protein FliK [Alphaproteobacteria bacterium]|nr:MAG: flagellar hook-length control protein FliK [Alphaproteobacteria bacterium]
MAGQSTRFELGLTPEGLGRVDVTLDIDSDGQLSARLAFDNPLAATELRGRADDLRRQLEDAGFTVAQDALEFSSRDSSSGGDRRQQRAAAYADRHAAQNDLTEAPPVWSLPSSNMTPRGVDVKV